MPRSRSTSIGFRGIIMSMVGVGFLELGLPINGIFALSAVLMAVSWLMLGRIRAPLPGQPEFEVRAQLRDLWPLRARNPRG